MDLHTKSYELPIKEFQYKVLNIKSRNATVNPNLKLVLKYEHRRICEHGYIFGEPDHFYF